MDKKLKQGVCSPIPDLDDNQLNQMSAQFNISGSIEDHGAEELVIASSQMTFKTAKDDIKSMIPILPMEEGDSLIVTVRAADGGIKATHSWKPKSVEDPGTYIGVSTELPKAGYQNLYRKYAESFKEMPNHLNQYHHALDCLFDREQRRAFSRQQDKD